VANQYRAEMKARRAAAAVVQSAYRGHQDRSALATQLLIEGPAAALLQGVVRGRKQRKAMLERAASTQAGADGTDGMLADDAAGEVAFASVGATDTVELNLHCSDGTLKLPLHIPVQGSTYHLGVSVMCADGQLPLNIAIDVSDHPDDAIADDVSQTLFLSASDGTVRLRLNIEAR